MWNVRAKKAIELCQVLTRLKVIANAGTIPVVSGSMGEAIHLVIMILPQQQVSKTNGLSHSRTAKRRRALYNLLVSLWMRWICRTSQLSQVLEELVLASLFNFAKMLQKLAQIMWWLFLQGTTPKPFWRIPPRSRSFSWISQRHRPCQCLYYPGPQSDRFLTPCSIIYNFPAVSGGIDMDSDLIVQIIKSSANVCGVKLTFVSILHFNKFG